MKKETVAWECPMCANKHTWKWNKGNAVEGMIDMHCAACGSDTYSALVRIGESTWALVWPGR